MKVKTQELSGFSLDYAVAKALCGERPTEDLIKLARADWYVMGWETCGKLIEKFICELESREPDVWEASGYGFTGDASTAQEAVARCVVLIKLGEKVEIPAEVYQL